MCHVLVIEDDWLIADHIISLIEQAGATSYDQADCETDAVFAAGARIPDMIVSDVRLREGTGPLAVQRIIAAHGNIPVMFITGTPEACVPCDPPAEVLDKPIMESAVLETFRRLAPH
ncbi:response regulator [Sphingomonas sp. ZB1N12]|jgi:CheY-like chemotaxis protein|uniref:response regulator n=1 Tax=Sphingomonas arabinosi TaxID=3096160 RepID=UPI00277FA9EA|nr:CheY-like chemotaxis protein [Sphingomonas faeni]